MARSSAAKATTEEMTSQSWDQSGLHSFLRGLRRVSQLIPQSRVDGTLIGSLLEHVPNGLAGLLGDLGVPEEVALEESPKSNLYSLLEGDSRSEET